MSKLRRAPVDELCARFKALSNPQRLRIFLTLTKRCGKAACEATEEGMRRCVGELGEDLDVGPSTVSHHLKELRQAGLICVERRGQKVECWVNDEALQALSAFFADAVERRAPQVVRRVVSGGRR
jgi:ArsR family transcriptional regulator, arsenate/arsenite/antimonite-responsive transcriptional repressor